MTAVKVLAIDAGSTGVRALVFEVDGRVAAEAYREVEARYPRPGWVEQDASLVWQHTLEVTQAALAAAGGTGRDLAAIGLTGQRSTAVIWSARTGRPLHPAISWQDLRTVERCNELLAAGHFVVPQAAATKLEWMVRSSPEVRAAIESGEALLGTMESWVAWKLTGGKAHVTDASFASTSGLYDFFDERWSSALLEVLGLPESKLPEIRASSEVYAPSDPVLLGASVPIAGMAGDQQAAMFGQLRFEPGETKVSYGTSAMVDSNTGAAPLLSTHGAYPLVLWRLAGETHYCLEGTAITAGAAVQWLRDGLGILGSAAESAALAASVPDTGGVWAVPAFQGLGTPHGDPAARAAIGGLSRGSTHAHVVRAVLEGVAHRVAEVVRTLAEDSGGGLPPVLRVDGGAAANDFLLQFQSDVLGLAVERPKTLEAATTGAAFLAGLAVGFWPDPLALKQAWRLGARFEPRMSSAEREERVARFQRQVTAVRAVGS